MLTIAVTGMNATDNPGPGVPVIRALRASGEPLRIVGLAYDTLDPGCYMAGIVDHAYLLPYPSHGADVLFERIMSIHARTPLDVIIPTLDAELSAFVRIAPRLDAAGIKTCLPTAPMLKRRAKDNLHHLPGVRTPNGTVLTSPSQIAQLDRHLQFPVMVKGQFYDASIAYTLADVHAHFERLRARWGVPVIVQEFVAGEEYDVVCVGDGQGGLLGSVPMRKMQLTDKGKAWGGVTVADPGLDAFVADTMAVLGWRGPCELEIMRCHDSGRHYLIEVNPRFPAWVFLSVGAGRNLPWLTVQLALGQPVKPLLPAPAGVMFLRHSVDQVVAMSEYMALTTAGEIHRAGVPTPPSPAFSQEAH